MTVAAQPDPYAQMTERARRMWSLGDFARAGAEQVIVGELLCRAIDIHPGQRVLDVAAGSGNAALAAARRGARVTATDFVPRLLESAARRARADGLDLETQEADAQDLPFADGTFDVVLSTFGVMFAPDQDRAAAELLRVCRPGGKIGLANWTPEGMIGKLFKILGKHLPPPAGVRPPSLWATEARIAEMFGKQADDIRIERRNFVFRYLSTQHWLDVFRTYYGPTLKAFGALEA